MGHTPHLYLPPPWPDDAVPISPIATHHLLKVLRLDPGAIVTYSDGAGRFGNGRLALRPSPRQSSRLEGSVLRGEEQLLPRPAVSITMAAPPPHDKDRLRFMIEKLGELEVQSIAFLRTQYGVGRLPDQSRSTAWAIGALEQSRGAWLMEVSPGWTDPGALDPRNLWFADMGSSELGGTLPDRLTLAIGPEGGWAPGEVPERAHRFGLGRTVLRVETAAIVAAALFRAQAEGHRAPRQ